MGTSRTLQLLPTYHPELPDIKPILRELHPILHNSEYLRDIFPLPPLVSFRRPKNLRDKLVRAKLPLVDSNEVEKDFALLVVVGPTACCVVLYPYCQ